MSLRSLLEAFDHADAANGPKAPVQDERRKEIEAARAEGFDAGYSSGWEDAHKSDEGSRQRVAAEFERNIENLAFTYHEAVDLVRTELFGFVDAVIERFLPDVVPDLTREYVRDALRRYGEDRLMIPVEIVVSSNCRAFVEELMSEDFSIELTLTEDPTLAPHQVFLRQADRETVIDLAPLLEAARAQLGAIKATGETARSVSHG